MQHKLSGELVARFVASDHFRQEVKPQPGKSRATIRASCKVKDWLQQIIYLLLWVAHFSLAW